MDYCWSSNDYKTRSIIVRQHSWYIQSARILWMNDRLIDGCTNLHRHECVYIASATAVSVCPTWPFNCCRCYFVCVFAASCDDTEQPGNPSTIMRLYTSHTHTCTYLRRTYRLPAATVNCILWVSESHGPSKKYARLANDDSLFIDNDNT